MSNSDLSPAVLYAEKVKITKIQDSDPKFTASKSGMVPKNVTIIQNYATYHLIVIL